MHTLRIGHCSRQLPETWNDLTPRQLCRVVAILGTTATEEEKRLRLFMACFVRTWWDVPAQWALYRFQRLLASDDDLTAVNALGNLQALLECTDWLLTTSGLTRNPFPVLKVGRKVLYGPSEGLANINGAEYAFAERYFLAYAEKQQPADLDMLIACLYRPAEYVDRLRSSGDDREPFRPGALEHIARLVKRVPTLKKQAIFTYYEHSREAIIERNPDIFTPKNETKSRKYDLGMVGLFLDLAGGLKDMESIAQTRLSLIFIELKRLLAQKEEMEKNMKRKS